MAPASPKTLFGQGWPRARRAVSDFLHIKKVKLRAAIRKVGKVPSRRLAFGRRQAGLKRVSRIKIERSHKVNPARPGGRSDRADTDVVFLQTENFLCERNVNRRIMLVECFGAFRIFVKDDNFCHSISPSAGDLLRYVQPGRTWSKPGIVPRIRYFRRLASNHCDRLLSVSHAVACHRSTISECEWLSMQKRFGPRSCVFRRSWRMACMPKASIPSICLAS